jgi:peroxiredoxin
MKKFLTAILFASLVHSLAFSQQPRTITGQVTSYEDGTPLEGVTVAVKGSGIQSGSQPDGIYYIAVGTNDSILVFSCPGFKTTELRIRSSNEYNVSLSHGSDKPLFPQGIWRGEFRFNDSVAVPFNFHLESIGNGESKVFLLNADEKLEGGSAILADDSLHISFALFDTELHAVLDGTTGKGLFHRQGFENSPVPVTIEWNNGSRFITPSRTPLKNISGTYDVDFLSEDGSSMKTVGLFTQEGSRLKGVFLRTTGDSRFLEGVVDGNEFYLSGFIGSGAAYYKGRINVDGSLSGHVIGARSRQPFEGRPNATAALPDPYSLTYLKPGYTSFDFSFPSLDGKKISLKDQRFRDKVVVLTITGTWCPNCIDEAAFLSDWYEKNKHRGVEALAIHYERNLDSAYLQKAINRFRTYHNITYPEVIGGRADKKEVAASLPALNSFLAFPTIIFIDRKGVVSKIYTGFSGPATGKYYQQFVNEFNAEIDRLLKQ